MWATALDDSAFICAEHGGPAIAIAGGESVPIASAAAVAVAISCNSKWMFAAKADLYMSALRMFSMHVLRLPSKAGFGLRC